MTITNGYATLAELKLKLDIPVATTTLDTEMEDVIMASSRAIDNYCNRRFYKSSVDEIFYFTPISGRMCYIDELVSLTTLKTDDDFDGTYETLWTTTDYNLIPYNDNPKTCIETTVMGQYWFSPMLQKSVEVVGKFGFPSVPYDIKLACLIWAARLQKRRDAILGIAGTTQFGQVKLIDVMDPDVKQILRAYVRVT